MDTGTQLTSSASGDVDRPPNQIAVRRTWHSKTRNGCLRCKARHVKCDETKPYCVRCQRINVQCPGYSTPRPRLFGLGEDECLQSDFEKICFQSFLAAGTIDLLASQPSASQFWTTYVPQLSQLYPAVRHATIAISVMQEPLVRLEIQQAQGHSIQDVRAMALGHFNQSIRSFLAAVNSLSTEAKLTCCVLYHILSIYLDRVPTGEPHVNAADFFLKEHEKAVARGELLYDSTIATQFAPLIHSNIVDASAFNDGFRNRFDYCGNPYELFRHLLPRLFANSSLEAINEHIRMLLNYSIGHYLGDFDQPDLILSLRMGLSNLQSFLEQMLRSNTPLPASTSEQGFKVRNVACIQIHVQTAFVFANTVRGDERDFDRYMQNFAAIITLAEGIASSEHASTWSVSLGIIAPLFMVATKCRDSQLRRKALLLLHGLHRVENAWSSCMASQLANVVIECEEEYNPTPSESSIPAKSRVRLEQALFDPNQAQMHFSYLAQYDSQAPHIVRASRPYNAVTLSDGSEGLGTLSNRVLWACGYSGPILSSPHLPCHCSLSP